MYIDHNKNKVKINYVNEITNYIYFIKKTTNIKDIQKGYLGK